MSRTHADKSRGYFTHLAGRNFPGAIGQSELFSALIVEDKDKLFCRSWRAKMRIAMSKQEDILAGILASPMKLRLSQNPPTLKAGHPPGRPFFRLDDAAKTHSVTLTLEVSSVEIMLADLLNTTTTR